LPVALAAMRRASERTLVLRLRLGEGAAFAWRPGQFIGLEAEDGRPRHFSIANAVPIDNQLELHVNRVPGGAFTGYLFDTAEVGDRLWMMGPYGDFSIPPDLRANTILVAGGTGFAPIKACLEQLAAAREAGAGASGTIHLYWGARTPADLYDRDGLAALIARLPGLRVTPVLDRGHAGCGVRTGLVHRALIEDFADLSGADIYACGAPVMIEALTRDCAIERGFDPARLTADVFLAGPVGDLLAPPAGRPIALIFSDPTPRAVRGLEGEALLFALKRAGADLAAVCGGKGACGTCGVSIAPRWRSRLPEPTRREARLLNFIGAEDGERLSCRIPLTADLDGLEMQTCANTKGDAQ
jgi:CDP-4-dehydro-6-deoxyglucose reductase